MVAFFAIFDTTRHCYLLSAISVAGVEPASSRLLAGLYPKVCLNRTRTLFSLLTMSYTLLFSAIPLLGVEPRPLNNS